MSTNARNQTFMRAVQALLVIAMMNSCQNDEPCMGLEKGDELRLTILEPYEGPSPPPACSSELASFLMLAAGSEINAKVRGFGGGEHISCVPALVDIEPIGDWTWTFRRADEATSDDIAGWYEITNGQCTALARFTVDDTKSGIL